ncbi:MAG: hypothetical protein ACO3EN_06370 [Candidatus Nanopelagicales bacterium]
MQKTTLTDWRSLYLYAVCLICIVTIIFTTFSLVDNIMRLVYPVPAYIDPYMSQPIKVDLELLKEQQAQTEFRNGITGLIGNITALIVVIPLFLVHWRLANKKPARSRR